MKIIRIAVLAILAAGCSVATEESSRETPRQHDMIYQYSILKALDNGVLEGSMTVGELKKQGLHGLGTFNMLNGELIGADGNIYQVTSDGLVSQPEDEELIPYAVVSFYNEEKNIPMQGEIDYPALKEFAEGELPSANRLYALRIYGVFDYIKCGSAYIQERPYDQSIAGMLEGRPIFEAENIQGVLVGYWCPQYVGDINSKGFHLHFLADDHTMGGHLLEFKARSLHVGYDIKTGLEIILPQSEDFDRNIFREEAVNY